MWAGSTLVGLVSPVNKTDGCESIWVTKSQLDLSCSLCQVRKSSGAKSLPILILFWFLVDFQNPIVWGFPGGAVVKNPPANAGDMGSSPGLGISHMPRSK